MSSGHCGAPWIHMAMKWDDQTTSVTWPTARKCVEVRMTQVWNSQDTNPSECLFSGDLHSKHCDFPWLFQFTKGTELDTLNWAIGPWNGGLLQ
jgi:hypothetical protein